MSPREVATTLVDEQVMYVSESTVYRILKEAGLIKPPETKGFPAGKEFHTKTARPNELWQTDASYFFVVGWGYYYLISVLDDYSRMIVGWRVQTSMSSADIIEVVQDAVEFTGQPTAPVEPGPTLLSDNGPGFLSRALDEFLRARFMKHIFASRVPGSGVRGRGSGERETTASSLAGKEESSRKEDNSGQGKDGPAGAIAQGGNER